MNQSNAFVIHFSFCKYSSYFCNNCQKRRFLTFIRHSMHACKFFHESLVNKKKIPKFANQTSEKEMMTKLKVLLYLLPCLLSAASLHAQSKSVSDSVLAAQRKAHIDSLREITPGAPLVIEGDTLFRIYSRKGA